MVEHFYPTPEAKAALRRLQCLMSRRPPPTSGAAPPHQLSHTCFQRPASTLEFPGWQKCVHAHSWFLHYMLGICSVRFYGFTTFKTEVTYKNTDHSEHGSQWLSSRGRQQTTQDASAWRHSRVSRGAADGGAQENHPQFSFMFTR